MPDKIVIRCEHCGKNLKVLPDKLFSSRGMNTERCPFCSGVLEDISRKAAEQTVRDARTVIDTASSNLTDLDLLTIEKQGEILIAGIDITSVLDREKALELDEEIRSIRKEAGFSVLIMNFGQVKFMSSMTVGRLVRFYKELASEGKNLLICNLQSSVREIFDIMELNKLFDIYDSEMEAIRAAKG